MLIYNTLSGKKEDLKKPLLGKLRFFVCGPTVYDYLHIGNARTFMSFDLLVKYWRSKGYKINYLMNITNVDDKIIARAKEKKIDPLDLAKDFETAFYSNMEALNIDSVDTYGLATDHINDVVKQVKTLIKKGNAYEILGDGWYFDLTTFKDYGKLSNRTVLAAEDGVSRIDDSDKKRNVGDFALWKLSPAPTDLPTLIYARNSKNIRVIDGELAWETELGWGRPGWHIEDTALTEHYFGPQYDLHGGGIDLKFPHHEAEIAQQESASGKTPFVKQWLHVGVLTIGGAKMSKGRGNFITINDFLKEFGGEVFRMFTLMHHYRSPVDYSTQVIVTAKKHLYDLRAVLAKLSLVGTVEEKIDFKLSPTKERYFNALNDDFNTPAGLGVIFELINFSNQNLNQLSKSQAKNIREFLLEIFTNLGFSGLEVHASKEVVNIAKERELFRINKQFNQSDALRKKIEALGYTIEDTPAGPLILPKSE